MRIRKLDCFPEVLDRIKEGWPLSEVARFIQDIKKEATDLTRAGLIATLQDFRSSLPPAELIKKRLTPTYIAAAEKVEEGLDELRELEKLYRLQMNRITIDVDNEKNIKKLLPSTGQEVRIAREILSTYADLKMDLGLSKRHLGQMDVDARLMADVAVRYNKTEVQSVLDNPQSRKKVLSLVERLVSRSATQLIREEEAKQQTIDAVAEPVEAPVVDAVVEPEGLFAEEVDPALDVVDPLASPLPDTTVASEEVES